MSWDKSHVERLLIQDDQLTEWFAGCQCADDWPLIAEFVNYHHNFWKLNLYCLIAIFVWKQQNHPNTRISSIMITLKEQINCFLQNIFLAFHQAANNHFRTTMICHVIECYTGLKKCINPCFYEIVTVKQSSLILNNTLSSRTRYFSDFSLRAVN